MSLKIAFYAVIALLALLVQINAHVLTVNELSQLQGSQVSEDLHKETPISEVENLLQQNVTEEEGEPYMERIVGGEPTNIKNFPHQVSLQLNSRHICGGAIISKNFVISAAHCVLYPVNPRSYSVRAGSTEHERGGQVLKVNRIIRHEKYVPTTNNNDIALLQLVNELIFNENMQPVHLPGQSAELIDGMELLVSGWGLRGELAVSLPRVLHYVTVQRINQNVCAANYRRLLSITPQMICAGFQLGGKDSCQGDSGGPLVYVDENGSTIYGIVSFGIGCAKAGFPGVYTNILALKPWILKNLPNENLDI